MLPLYPLLARCNRKVYPNLPRMSITDWVSSLAEAHVSVITETYEERNGTGSNHTQHE